MAKKNTLTIGQALIEAAGRLTTAGITGARFDAERLLCRVMNCKRHVLFVNSRETLRIDSLSRFLDYVERRALREPLQYITGEEEFRGLAFNVTRDTLIPRPETELLVEEALSLALSLKDDCGIFIDLCTGSGCVAVSIAKEMPRAVIYATDISQGALAVARENAEKHKVADRITFVQGDLFTPLEALCLREAASFILSNPPYVAKGDFENLQPEIKDYEPAAALLAGEDGLEFYRRIIPASPDYLKQGGYLIMEIGCGQAKSLSDMIARSRMFAGVEFIKDPQGIERVLRARKK